MINLDEIKKQKTEEAEAFFNELEITDKGYSIKDFQSFVDNMNVINSKSEIKVIQDPK